jgi:hypothetical protein
MLRAPPASCRAPAEISLLYAWRPLLEGMQQSWHGTTMLHGCFVQRRVLKRLQLHLKLLRTQQNISGLIPGCTGPVIGSRAT